jgi:cellulose synthase/poly-beta-1,6-N-acetylglucosamine synthase-like glycosyltransferase
MQQCPTKPCSNVHATAIAAVTGSAAAIAGVYVAFPAVLYAASRIRPRPIRPGQGDPISVSVVIAAYDEAESIERKLDDVHAQHLDAIATPLQVKSIQVIVASDGSTDGTVDVALAHPSSPTVLDLPRSGKAAAMNRALHEASGDVVIFTDANSRLPEHSFAHLLAPFADPEVGGVAGDQRYGERPSGPAQGERSYWSYERLLKRWESSVGNVVSSTGTLHAIRRELIDNIPADVTDDFFLSVGVICRGRRLVFAPEAVAWEEPNDRPSAEYRRRVRIITRGLNGVRRRRELLDPRTHGGYAPMLFVHKVARRLIFVPMLLTLVGSFVVRRRSWIWRLLWTSQVAFYGVSVVGAVDPTGKAGRNKPVALLTHFCLANVAAAHAVWNVLRSHDYVTWTPERS